MKAIIVLHVCMTVLLNAACNPKHYKEPTDRDPRNLSSSSSTDTALSETIADGKLNLDLDQASTKWRYNERADPLGNHPVYVAEVNAEEKVVLNNPSRLATVMLGVRYKRDQQRVALIVSSGEFAWVKDELPIQVKFDNEKLETYYCIMSSSGMTNAASVKGDDFLDKLKHARKVMIEVEFFKEGVRDMLFDVHGLIWVH